MMILVVPEGSVPRTDMTMVRSEGTIRSNIDSFPLVKTAPITKSVYRDMMRDNCHHELNIDVVLQLSSSAMISNWYHLEVTESVPCPHCLECQFQPPHTFPVQQLTLGESNQGEVDLVDSTSYHLLCYMCQLLRVESVL